MILNQLSSPTLGQFNGQKTHHKTELSSSKQSSPHPWVVFVCCCFGVVVVVFWGGRGGGGWLVTVVVGMRRDSSFNRPQELVKFSFAWFPFFCIATKCLIPHRPYHYTTKATKHTNRKGKNTERKKKRKKNKHNRKQNQILILRKTHQVVCL